MKRASAPSTALSTWCYLAVGGALTVAVLSASDPMVRMTLHTVASAQLLPVLLYASRRNGLTRRTAAVLATIGCLAGAACMVAGLRPVWASAPAAILEFTSAAILVVGLTSLVRRRSGGTIASVGADAVVVAAAAWLASWVAFSRSGHHMITHGLTTVLVHAQIPLMAVAVFLAGTLLLDIRNRTASSGLLVGALVAAAPADVLGTMVTAGAISTAAQHLAVTLHVAAFFAVGGAVLHPSVVESNRNQPHRRGSDATRVAVAAGSLVAPMLALAVWPAQSSVDRTVRVVGVLLLVAAVSRNVTNAVRAGRQVQAELLQGAQTDPLTGLPNRQVLVQSINRLMATGWEPEQHPTLFFIDLDRFKNINDSLGHAAGDEVLVMVAHRLMRAVRPTSTVARWSSDEYVVLCPDLHSEQAAMALAERLLTVFREPLALSQGDVFVGASIGVATISPTSAASPEDLVRHADTAMYRAKDAGRNCIAVYDESMHERVSHRLAVETALHRALDRRELRLYHQPIIELASGDVVGFEALMRWQQSDGTIVSPAEFIPIAEETGTIVPIGAWALLEALSQLRLWIDSGVCSSTATISVNVSPRQLADPNFPAIVSEALTRSRVSPQLLWLEVTESVMITEPELALSTLRRLRSLGVRVALDDFGTGYSSLSLLQKFPLQRIKIDRAFVHGVADNPNDRSLVRTIVAMGTSLGLDLVAEGVESVHQLQVLSDLGCDKAQGFLISHPVPPDAMRSTVAALERLGRFPGLHASATR